VDYQAAEDEVTLADAALIGMQWIQEAQNGCVEQRDVAADTRRDRADDGVLPDSQPDGEVGDAAAH